MSESPPPSPGDTAPDESLQAAYIEQIKNLEAIAREHRHELTTPRQYHLRE